MYVHRNGLLSKYETYDVFCKMLFRLYVDLNFKHNLTVVQTHIEKKLQYIDKILKLVSTLLFIMALRWKLYTLKHSRCTYI